MHNQASNNDIYLDVTFILSCQLRKSPRTSTHKTSELLEPTKTSSPLEINNLCSKIGMGRIYENTERYHFPTHRLKANLKFITSF